MTDLSFSFRFRLVRGSAVSTQQPKETSFDLTKLRDFDYINVKEVEEARPSSKKDLVLWFMVWMLKEQGSFNTKDLRKELFQNDVSFGYVNLLVWKYRKILKKHSILESFKDSKDKRIIYYRISEDFAERSMVQLFFLIKHLEAHEALQISRN